MKRARKRFGWLELLLLILLVLFLLPLYVVVISSVKSPEEMLVSSLRLPSKITFDNFAEIVAKTDFLPSLWNTVVITVVTVVVIILLGSAASFAIARRGSRWNRWVYLYMLSGMMIPFQVASIPLVKLLLRLQLYGSFTGLILTYLGLFLPLVVFLYAGFMKSIPRELDESAIMDGCSPFVLFWRIIMPLLQPCTATVVIFIGLFSYNDFFTPLVLLSSNSGHTVYLSIFRFVDQYNSQWNIVFAGVLLGLLPVLLLFLVMQRSFIKGLTTGSVKG